MTFLKAFQISESCTCLPHISSPPFTLKILDPRKGPIFVQGSVFVQGPIASESSIWGDSGVP